MPVASIADQDRSKANAKRTRTLQRLPFRTYPFRVLGMGLAALPVGMVMAELDSSWLAWSWMIFSCLAWPHVAYLWATRSSDPFQAELRNFMIDSVIAGTWAPLLHFNILPSVVLLTVATADKVNSGVRNLWLRSLPGMFGAVVVVGLATGFKFDPTTSMAVLLSCLPILIIHTLAVSRSSYLLVRKVQQQNIQLDELSRIDPLTGLVNRRHWQTQADAVLLAHAGEGHDATLMLVDVDRFKEINDRYGHAVGDDVLCAIAEVIRAGLWADSHAGRLGGDEFVVALPIDLAEAEVVAERIRAAVEALEIARYPGLRCSISVGLAPAPDGVLGLREWIEAADRALYRAKRAGRNRTVGRDAIQQTDG